MVLMPLFVYLAYSFQLNDFRCFFLKLSKVGNLYNSNNLSCRVPQHICLGGSQSTGSVKIDAQLQHSILLGDVFKAVQYFKPFLKNTLSNSIRTVLVFALPSFTFLHSQWSCPSPYLRSSLKSRHSPGRT